VLAIQKSINWKVLSMALFSIVFLACQAYAQEGALLLSRMSGAEVEKEVERPKAKSKDHKSTDLIIKFGLFSGRFQSGMISGSENVPMDPSVETFPVMVELSFPVYRKLNLWLDVGTDLRPALILINKSDNTLYITDPDQGLTNVPVLPKEDVYAGFSLMSVRAGVKYALVHSEHFRITLGLGFGLYSYRVGFYGDKNMESTWGEAKGTTFGPNIPFAVEFRFSRFILSAGVDYSAAVADTEITNLFIDGYTWSREQQLGGFRGSLGVGFSI
jgi:hypothetical protein